MTNPIPLPGAPKSPQLPDLPQQAVTPNNSPHKYAAMRNDARMVGDYGLVDKSNADEEWSRPEWARFLKKNVAALFIMIGSVFLLTTPGISDEAKLIGTILGPAAGFALLGEEASRNRQQR